MSKNIERIDHYLKNLNLPEHDAGPHRHELRRRVLSEIERKRTMPTTSKTWKVALAVAAVVCGGAMATAVGMKLYRYHFEGQDAEGNYHFATEPETVYERTGDGDEESVTVVTGIGASIGAGNSSGGNIEQMQNDLEEIARLRQQDDRELVRVTDMQVNGHYWRGCSFRYTLSDGRTHTIGEPDPDESQLGGSGDVEADLAEIEELRALGLRQIVTAVDTTVEGQTHRTLICRYVLAGGREMTMGETDTEVPLPTVMLTPEQDAELTQMLRLKQGEYLGRQEKEIHGKIFAFEAYRVTLSDGTVATRAEGEPLVGKTRLTQADWRELKDLAQADAGENLGTYEEEIRGQVFVFQRHRYILSDGTEVIRADGSPRTN